MERRVRERCHSVNTNETSSASLINGQYTQAWYYSAEHVGAIRDGQVAGFSDAGRTADKLLNRRRFLLFR